MTDETCLSRANGTVVSRFDDLDERVDRTERSSELALRKLVELDQCTANVLAVTNGRIDGIEKELDVLYDALWDAQDHIEEL